MYVGSASQSIRGRLTQHFWKLAGRQNIAADEVTFTCLYVDEDLTVLAPEDRLIRVFQDEGSCEWNGNGFGLHDPGRNRDTTELRPDHFDLRYPVRLDWQCDEIEAGEWTARELLGALKRTLPYLLRYANTPADRARYDAATVDVPEDGMEATELFELLADELPGYQITALPGYVDHVPREPRLPSGRVHLGGELTDAEAQSPRRRRHAGLSCMERSTNIPSDA